MNSQDGLGSMVQLKALGPQNKFTSAYPSTSPFIKIFRQRFHFSNFQARIDLPITRTGDIIRVNLNNHEHGDLMNDVIFKCTLPQIGLPLGPVGRRIWYTDSVGHVLIEKIELIVGNVVIDTIDGDWLEVYDNEFLSGNKYDTMSELVQRGKGQTLGQTSPIDLWIPIRFYFDRKIGTSFPFCAFPDQNVQLVIYTRDEHHLVNTNTIAGNWYGKPFLNIPPNNPFNAANISSKIELYNAAIITNQYLLDRRLREYLATEPLTYVVKTNLKAPAHDFDESNPTEFSNNNYLRYYPDTNATISLLTWGFRSNAAMAANTVYGSGNDRFNFSNAMISCGTFLGNEWVNSTRIGDAKYWRYLQPLMALPSCPKKELYNWSFGIKNTPSSSQEWGGTDFSRIRGRTFFLEFYLSELNLQPVLFMNVTNYLRIENGTIKDFYMY